MSTILAAAIWVVTAQTPLEQAQEACARDVKACARVRELKAAAEADAERRYQELEALRRTQAQQRAEAEQVEAEAERLKEEKLAKTCGKDLGRVRVGMSFKRVAQCAGSFDLVGQDGNASVYEAEGGFVRVVNGKVTRWIAK